jgi:hypothetical protein
LSGFSAIAEKAMKTIVTVNAILFDFIGHTFQFSALTHICGRCPMLLFNT